MRTPIVHTWRPRAAAALALVALAATTAWGAIFTDIVGLPAQRAIERLAVKGIFRISGDRFTPSAAVSRAELALYVARVLGVSEQGVLPPEFKDVADIPKDALLAVAVMANMGTVSPQKVEVKKGPVVYTLAADKSVYAPREEVVLRFTVRNTGTEDVKFEYASNLHFDFAIRDSAGGEIARRSIGMPVVQGDQTATLVAGKEIVFGPVRWFQLDQNDAMVGPGRYEVTAIHLTKAGPVTLSLAFNRGLMTAFPDNTFRPKAEVTRAELATTVVRALGFGESSAVPAVGDAAEIPAASRGAVAVAVEKEIVLVGPDRLFWPNRSASRADLAVALDAVMTTLNRYEFSKGTVKDIRVGTPTLLVLEDDKKAFVTYRVARANAVYRDKTPIDLKDLKVGDVVFFVKIGDVGDIVYIQAASR